MHLIKTSRSSQGARRRRSSLSAIAALFAATALALAPTSASADTTFSASAYNEFACPVVTDASAVALDDYALRVYTNIKIGHNPMWFNACRARVFVDIVNKQGATMNTFIYEPWAGPSSTNYLSAQANAYGHVSDVSHIRITQQPRYKS